MWHKFVLDSITIIGAVAAQAVAVFTGRAKDFEGVRLSEKSRLCAAFCLE